jgi:hypothetical protein
MGGAGKSGQWYEDVLDTKWRDIGSSLCMLSLFVGSISGWKIVVVAAMLFWGCISYFGWVNSVVRLWWQDIEMEREYWWNFFAENLMIQSTALLVSFNPVSVALSVCFAGLSAVGKVLIDEGEEGYYRFFCFEVREDVLSEWWHGFSNCVFLAINVAV